MERMKSRKVCCKQEECDDDSSSHSSESHPNVTWDETSTTSWGEEGVHLMDGFQHWYGFEDFQLQENEDTWVRYGVSSSEERSWMIRLIDEDMEDRPTSTFPAAMERMNSGETREDVIGEEQRTGVDEESTPRTSNSTSRSKTHFDDHVDTQGVIEAVEEDEVTKSTTRCGC
jgi:hypothetical protein